MTRTDNKPRKPRYKRIARWVFALVLLVVLGPYLFSRVLSPWRVVTTHRVADAEPKGDAPRDTPLRVGVYNIAHGRGLAEDNWSGGDADERAARLREIGRLLAGAELDIVVLNEVDFAATWSGGTNQARALAREADFAYVAEQRNLDFAVAHYQWRFGNAVLSKYPIVAAEALDLPDYAAWETLLAGKKQGVLCTIELSPQRRIRVLGVHLSHRSEAIRLESVRMIDEVSRLEGPPLLVGGDLNSTPSGFPHSGSTSAGENAMDWLRDNSNLITHPTEKPEPGELTFPSGAPRSVIDWIAIPKGWSFADYKVLQSTLSDHLPVMAELFMDER